MNDKADTGKNAEHIPQYMRRVNSLKERVISTRPEMDLENARILTEGFIEAEGQPLVVQKAIAFRKQCQDKSVKIWDQELIVVETAEVIFHFP